MKDGHWIGLSKACSVVVKGELMKEVMNPEHKKWEEFIGKLEGEGRCNFQDSPKLSWQCKNDHSFSVKLLEEMGNIDVASSLEYFCNNGGFCDCEIIFNVVK